MPDLSNHDVTIFHHPQCGTSRNALQLIRQAGIEPEIVEYLKTPLDRESLVALIGLLDVPVRSILRQAGSPFDELGLADTCWSDGELIDFIVAHPMLLNRPIVVTPLGARLCRPSELVLDLLQEPAPAAAPRRQGESHGVDWRT
jgi:arsenate reductase (glutaredoxin)